jgi:hypothetical protein
MSSVNRKLTCKNSEQIIITIQLLTVTDAKYSAAGKAAGWGLRPRPSCSYQVSGAQNIHNSDNRKIIEECFISCFVFSKCY